MFHAAYRTSWRRERLLILGYHGVSLHDEHQWNPQLYMSAEHLAQRFQQLKDDGCNVLPLDEAVRHLYAGTLPERSVSITFDDGFHDFFQSALPLLRQFGFPATLYLTTYYTGRQMPVFPLICEYITWRARSERFEGWPDSGLPSSLDLRTAESRSRVVNALHRFATRSHLSAPERNCIAAQLARHVDVDYDAILQNRQLQLMTREEVRAVSDSGIHIELHTHRHRSPSNRDPFVREISQNAELIRHITGRQPSHFCYPSGVHWPQHLDWLRALDVSSGVTCTPGLACSTDDCLLLPRVVDSSGISQAEFQGWLSGAAALLPRRRAERFVAQPDPVEWTEQLTPTTQMNS